MVRAIHALPLILLLGPGPVQAVQLLAGDWVVADPDANAIYRVDPDSGGAIVISQDGLFRQPTGVAIDAARRVLVADPEANAIFRVDAATGAQSVVSSGGQFRWPTGVAVDALGDLLVADPDADAVFRVDPSTGQQTPDTAAADTGVLYGAGLTVEGSGDYVLVDPDSASLRRWDPDAETGAPVSAGRLLRWPSDATVDDLGDLLVADPDANAFRRVDPGSGAQTQEGPADVFLYPTGIAFVPEPSGWASLLSGAAALVALARRRRPGRT
jgi:sugar lactone lactonase YvrE